MEEMITTGVTLHEKKGRKKEIIKRSREGGTVYGLRKA